MEKKYIGKYMVIRVLGEGGEGNVYLARDEELQRMVAIKQMLEGTGKRKQEGNLIREAEFLQRFRHPMLPVVYDLVWDEAWYLVMEYIRGITLRDYIDRNGYVQEERAYTWIQQQLDVLGYLHTRRPPVIYRDFKPDNIIVCPDGHLRLVDFGGAAVKNYGMRECSVMAVTPGYGAPEQSGMTGQRVYADERSDIYALGKVMYYMLTGADPAKPPYAELPVCDYQPLVHRRLERIIRRCIEEDPGRRYQMTEEISRDLAKCYGRRCRQRRKTFIRIVEKKLWLTEM